MLQQGAAHCEGGMTETGNLSNFRFLQSEGYNLVTVGLSVSFACWIVLG